MKKYVDKFKSNIHINKNLFVFLFVIVLVGVVSGSIFALIIDTDDKKMVFDYLTSFFNNTSAGKLDYNNTIINTLIFTVGLALLIWILGVSVIGFVIILFLLFLKAFVLGFSVSSIIVGFKFKGALMALIYAFPHQIINIMVFILISAYALIVSFKIIKCMSGKKNLDFKNIINKYVTVLIIGVVVLVITSVYEVYLMPKLLNITMTLIK